MNGVREHLVEHHSIIEAADNGAWPEDEGYYTNFVGARFRKAFLTGDHASQIAGKPGFTEEYFEWIDVLEAVRAATDRFVMIELGAGFGRWMINAACAARRLNNVPVTLVGVEAEPQHYAWMETAFADNGIPSDAYRLHRAAVGAKNGSTYLYLRWPPDRYYGQRVVGDRHDKHLRRGHAPVVDTYGATDVYELRDGERAIRVDRIGIKSLLKAYRTVDLIDLDIQGTELEVLTAARKHLARRVKRVHIGTHSPEIEAGLRTLFTGLGWHCVWDFGTGRTNPTPYGPIAFVDGVQGWVNPRWYPQGAA